jgi:hypothetical protein
VFARDAVRLAPIETAGGISTPSGSLGFSCRRSAASRGQRRRRQVIGHDESLHRIRKVDCSPAGLSLDSVAHVNGPATGHRSGAGKSPHVGHTKIFMGVGNPCRVHFRSRAGHTHPGLTPAHVDGALDAGPHLCWPRRPICSRRAPAHPTPAVASHRQPRTLGQCSSARRHPPSVTQR